jgi:long-subunit fatty acid transport protein
MKTKVLLEITKRLTFGFFLLLNLVLFGQETPVETSKSNFWNKVQFGGGIGLGIGNGFTNISLAPSGIYNFNKYFSAGLGVQYSYLKQKDFYSSSMYGGSIIGLAQPIDQIQISVELEQLRVNLDYDNINVSDSFWNTGLFLGAGYHMNGVTLGARYNLLFQDDKGVYGDALMPFIRVYF